MESKEQKYRCGDLSLAQFNLLMIVRSSGEITGGELAARLGVSPPSVSTMVDKLVAREMLVRQRSSEDRRKVVLQMSSGEAHHFAAVEKEILKNFVALIEEVGEDTASKWVEVLSEVEQVLQKKIRKGRL
jgi:DNA-binding MarR family transcriptional regulator